MRSVDEHLARVLDSVRPLPLIEVGLMDARGCILAEDVKAPWPLPAFDNSATDGYAVQTGSVGSASPQTPVTLQVVDDIPAGTRPRAMIGPGTAARIMTGAPMPYGADAVVPVEHTDGGMPKVQVFESTRVGHGMRRAGDDVPAGATVLSASSVMDARKAALAAAVGRSRVQVHPRPRVVVLTTGNELVEPGRQLGPGTSYDVNGIALSIAAADLGALTYRVGPVKDDPAILADVLEDQLVRADVIITTGGVSLGVYDTVKQVVSRLGTMEFSRVAMQPGMPQGHGNIAGVPIFTLPGNPVSAYVSFEVFIRPVLRRLLGYQQLSRPTVQARVLSSFDSPAGRRQFARGHLSMGPDGFVFDPSPGQANHQVGVLAHSSGLAVVPEEVKHVPAGSMVTVMRLDLDSDMA